MFVSVRRQHESVIGTHMSLPSWIYLPPHPTPLGCHRVLVWVPWVIQLIPPGFLFHIRWCVFPCYSLHPSCPPLRPVCPQVCSVCVTSIAITVISGGTEDDWRCLEGFTAEMPLGLNSQIGIHKWKEREGYISRVALYTKRHMMMGNWMKGDY